MDTQKSPRPAASIKSRSRCTWSVEERTEWLRLLDASGQTLSEFCRTNDLPESTVSLWRRQQREASQATTEASEFVIRASSLELSTERSTDPEFSSRCPDYCGSNVPGFAGNNRNRDLSAWTARASPLFYIIYIIRIFGTGRRRRFCKLPSTILFSNCPPQVT